VQRIRTWRPGKDSPLGKVAHHLFGEEGVSCGTRADLGGYVRQRRVAAEEPGGKCRAL
jgi:hypothetical protein